MMRVLAFAARHGRAALVLGLLAGLLLPGLAQALKPWIPQMVAGLLFLNAFRIGVTRALGGLGDGVVTIKATLVLQLAMPLCALALFLSLGIAGTPLATALLLMLCAPSLTGNPNITQMMGYAPEPAFRMLILGTTLLPFTLIPVFLLAPDLGDLPHVLRAAGRLLVAIAVTVAIAFVLRRLFTPGLSGAKAEAVDGLTTVMLAVIVIGLMAALGPALRSDPILVLKWLVVVLVADFGLQYATFRWLLWRGQLQEAVPIGVVAGNRNFALFLIALPAATTDPLLIFLGCYQVPMYLTAILMRPLYARAMAQAPQPNT